MAKLWIFAIASLLWRPRSLAESSTQLKVWDSITDHCLWGNLNNNLNQTAVMKAAKEQGLNEGVSLHFELNSAEKYEQEMQKENIALPAKLHICRR